MFRRTNHTPAVAGKPVLGLRCLATHKRRNILHRIARFCLVFVAGVVVFMGRAETPVYAQRQTETGAKELIYKCDTPGVSLEGVLTERTFYGPPGHGETPSKDAREKAYLLKLRKPVTMSPIENPKEKTCWDAFTHVRMVQLFIPAENKMDVSRLLGKNVVVTGTIREGDAPSEHTKVTMDVQRILPSIRPLHR